MKQGIRSFLMIFFLVPVVIPVAAMEVGVASFYKRGDSGGDRTANGERLDDRAFTAAHRHLPFGTRVRVTCLTSHKSVVVRINDRGPYIDGRVIDLSRAAFGRLASEKTGVISVRLEVIDPEPTVTPEPHSESRRCGSVAVIYSAVCRHGNMTTVSSDTLLGDDYRVILLEVASRLQLPVMRVPADVGPTLTVGQVIAFYNQYD